MAQRGRPINIKLLKEFESTSWDFVVRNFGVKGKVADIGAKNVIDLHDFIVQTYKPSRLTLSDGKEIITSRGKNKRQGITRMREGGIYDRAMTQGGRWNKKGAVDVEKFVRYVFGTPTLNAQRERLEKIIAIKTGEKRDVSLNEWEFSDVLKSILQNNSEFYDSLDAEGKELVRERNQALHDKDKDFSALDVDVNERYQEYVAQTKAKGDLIKEDIAKEEQEFYDMLARKIKKKK